MWSLYIASKMIYHSSHIRFGGVDLNFDRLERTKFFKNRSCGKSFHEPSKGLSSNSVPIKAALEESHEMGNDGAEALNQQHIEVINAK